MIAYDHHGSNANKTKSITCKMEIISLLFEKKIKKKMKEKTFHFVRAEAMRKMEIKANITCLSWRVHRSH